MKFIRPKHSLATRWFHWINFPLIFLMMYSGICIYWANDVYKIEIGSHQIFSFFPEAFYNALDIPFHLAMGMAWHFTFMWIFIINGILYVAYTLISGEWKFLVPDKNSFREAYLVTLHDLGIRKTKPASGKYNGAQKIVYTTIIIMGSGSVLTGLAIYKPVQLSVLTILMGGYTTARLLHFCLTIGYIVFFIIHIVQVLRAGWNNLRAMIAGYETVSKVSENNIKN